MSPSFAKQLADRLQTWTPNLAIIGDSIQDSLPRSSEEVKQKLRSWNKSLGKQFKNRRFYSGYPDEEARAARDQKTRTSLDLFAARKAVAENARIARELKGPEMVERHGPGFGGIHGQNAARTPYSESRRASSIVRIDEESPQVDVGNLHDNFPRRTTSLRNSLPRSFHSTTAIGSNDERMQASEMHRTIRDKEELYYLKLREAPPHPAPTKPAALRYSASASNLADHVIDSVKRLKRSASNVSLRRKSGRSDHDEPTAQWVDSQRHSAPPPGRRNTIQRSYTSLDLLHPDQYPDARGTFLESIAENGDYQHPSSEVVRRDMIFAQHESRTSSPRPSSDFVERPLFSNDNTCARRCKSPAGLEMPSHEPRRISSLHDRRASTVSIQLTEQINRISDLAVLRTSINNTRALCGVPPLLFYQNLCAEAKIVATAYEMFHGAGTGTWSTQFRLQKHPATLELIGPPDVGARVTGKIWADGRYSRNTQSMHAKFSPRDHAGCQCHNYKVWEAITDARWRAVGLSRTEDEERWVVVLSE